LTFPPAIKKIRDASKLKKFFGEFPEAEDALTRNFAKDEVRNEIKRMKNNKAHGPDALIAEAYKILEPHISAQYAEILNMLNHGDGFPKKWRYGAIAYICKNKGKKPMPQTTGQFALQT